MSLEIEIGVVVKSLKGRDKEKYFCVVGIEEKSALICDGKQHKLDKPKHKSLKHLKITQHKLQTETLQVNKHIYKALKSLNILEE